MATLLSSALQRAFEPEYSRKTTYLFVDEFHNFVSESMNLVDIVVKGDEFLEDRLEKAFEKATSKKFDYVSGESITEVY